MPSSESTLNSVEQKHRDAILAAGNNPTDWLIGSQIASWDERHGWSLGAAEAAELRRLSKGASSRYEIAEMLQLYSIAESSIQLMQSTSQDRQDFRPAHFRIATEPGALLHAKTVQHEWHVRQKEDRLEEAKSTESTVWIPATILNIFGGIAGVVVKRLIFAAGGFDELICALASTMTWDMAYELLAEGSRLDFTGFRPAPEGRSAIYVPNGLDVPDTESPLGRIDFLTKVAITTFVAGHEAGHLYLGHFFDRAVIELIRGGDLSVVLKEEIGADMVGIAAVWDGLSSTASMSIDYSWIGPILALAVSAGLAAAHPGTDAGTRDDTCDSWIVRLEYCLIVLARWLRGNAFEPVRVERILGAATPLSVAVYEYMRGGGELLDAAGRLGPSGDDLYERLEAVVLRELCSDYTRS